MCILRCENVFLMRFDALKFVLEACVYNFYSVKRLYFWELARCCRDICLSGQTYFNSIVLLNIVESLKMNVVFGNAILLVAIFIMCKYSFWYKHFCTPLISPTPVTNHQNACTQILAPLLFDYKTPNPTALTNEYPFLKVHVTTKKLTLLQKI